MIRIAFQGEHGAYSELAASALWPDSECVAHRENIDVVRAVANAVVDAGILALENSIAGPVTATLDALLGEDDVHITGEAIIPIHHCLLGVPGASLDDVRWVESHPIALASCRAFFASNPGLAPRPVYDTAGAARDVAAAGDRSRAALAGAPAAARYGLSVLARDIDGGRDNRTRFVAIERSPALARVGASYKTTLAIAIDVMSGAVLRVLTPITDHGLGLAWVGTHPAEQPGTCTAVVDVQHHAGDTRLGEAIAGVRRLTRACRVLGTYPVAARAS